MSPSCYNTLYLPRVLTLVFLVFLALSTAPKFRPGLVAKFPKKSLFPITAMALPTLNPLISHLEIDERFEMSIITLKGFDLDVSPLSTDQIQYDFASDPSAIYTTVLNLKFAFRSPVDIHVWVFQSKGWIRATGKVARIRFRTAGRPFDQDYHDKPYVQLSFDQLEISADDIDIHADIDWVPDFIMNQILYFIKTTVVEAVRKAILDWLNTTFTPNINNQIKEQFPDNVRIGDMDCSLQVAHTDPLYQDANNVFFPLDGTIFLTGRGYSRTEDALPMDKGPEWGHTFEFYFSEYSARRFFACIAKQVYDFKVTNFMASISSLDEEVRLTISERGIQFDGLRTTEKVTAYTNHVNMDTKLSGAMKPWITKDDEGFVLNMEMTGLAVEEMKIDTSYAVLATLGDVLPSTIEAYFKVYPQCSMPMPDIDLYGHKWRDWDIRAREGHLRVGISI